MVGIYLIFILLLHGSLVVVGSCDPSTKIIPKEGNNGQTGELSWLGILRVHLHYEREFKVAITGIILVKVGYAIVNAHDVVRVPKRTLREDSEAMFIAAENRPWRCRLKEYHAHPEYQYSTMNTLALVQLEPLEDDYYPMLPICWPPRNYKNSNNLYAVGYTDENMLLEKTIYRLESVSQEKCDEFYHRAGLSEGMMAPLHYRCGFAVNNRNNCVWDNGMALVTNSTGYWSLLGFSIHGPGCSGPARFLDLQVYLPWVESLTSVQEMEGRRQADGWTSRSLYTYSDSFGAVNVDIHDLFGIDVPAVVPPFGKQSDKLYPFLTTEDNVMEFNIQRVNQSAILIHKLVDPIYSGGPVQYGTCPERKSLIYLDVISIKCNLTTSYDYNNTMVYKISLFDLRYMNYTCVLLNVQSGYQDLAYLYFKKELSVQHAHISTPEELLRFYPMKDVTRNRTGSSPHTRPQAVSALWDTIRNVENVNLYVRVQFVKEASLELYIYGDKREQTRHVTRPRRLRSTVTPPTTSNPYVNESRRAGNVVKYVDKLDNLRARKLLAEDYRRINYSYNCGDVYYGRLYVMLCVMVFLMF